MINRIIFWGSSDTDGLAWFTIFSLIGVTAVFLIVFFAALVNKKSSHNTKILGIAFYCIMLSLYYFNFSDLGMSYINNPTNQIEVAKKQKLFVGEIEFSDTILTNGNDTFILNNGWAERETKYAHTSFFKTNKRTNRLVYLMKIKNGNGENIRDPTIWWQVNDSSWNGSAPIDTLINFSSPVSKAENEVYFFAEVNNEFRCIKKIVVKRKTE